MKHLPVRNSFVGSTFNLGEEYKESEYSKEYQLRNVDKEMSDVTIGQKKPSTSIMER